MRYLAIDLGDKRTGLAVGDDELKTEEYKTQPARLRDKEFIDGRVRDILATDTCENWMTKLREARPTIW